jgi:hypothetical protein
MPETVWHLKTKYAELAPFLSIIKKMKCFKYKLIASFLSALIILLPFYVSDVYATGLTVNKVSGEDNVNGYRKKYDKTVIDVDAAVDGDDKVSKEQLKVTIDGGPIAYPFTSCTNKEGYANCVYSRTGDITAGTHTYDISVYSDDETLLLTKNVEISVDNLAPEIVSLETKPDVTITGDVSIDYTVQDYAYEKGDVSKCTGIEKIEFYKDDLSGSLIKRVEPATKDCVVSGSVDYTSGIKDGTVNICAKAEDRFKQGSTELVCSSFRVDKSAPVITNLRIRDSSGDDVTYVTSQALEVEVSVDIKEEELDLSSITADLSSLNKGDGYQDKQPDSCSTTGSVTTCIWNVDIELSSSVNADIQVRASDNAGNIATETLTKQLTYDSIGPVVVQIETDKGLYRGNGYAGSTTTFIAYVLEKGIGIGDGDIYLDLSEIGLGNSVKADECMLGMDGWECYWYDKNVNAQDGSIVTILSTSDSKDDLGNLAVGIFGAEFVVDSSPPVVEFVNTTTIHGEMAYDENTIKGDSLDIVAFVSEPTSVSAIADLSGIISYGENAPGECGYTGTKWKCFWQTKPIDVSGPYTANIKLEFEDFVGNKAERTVTLQIVGLSNDTSPNYWKNEVSCAPSKIDRQVTTLINQRVYCHVKLKPLHDEQNPETLSISLDDCYESGNNSPLDYVKSIDLMNDFAGSTDPYLKFTLKTASMEIDNLRFDCKLSIVSKVGDFITPYSETENVSITIPFYNLPLGEYSDNIQQKIKDAEDAATGGLWKLIGGLNKFLKYAKLICNVYSTIVRVVALWKGIGKILSGKATAAKAFPPSYPIFRGIRVGTDTSTEYFREEALDIFAFMVPFCKFVNCQMSPAKEDESKTKGGLFSGKWFNILGGGGGIAKTIEEEGWLGSGVVTERDERGRAVSGTGIIGAHFGKNPSEYLNSKESLVMSVLTTCVPGIIYNLNKYRQIQCMYADCLQKSVDSGVPIKVCEDQKSYSTCKYIFGEIFQVIPYTALFDYYMRILKNALSDPLSVTGAALGYVCMPAVNAPDDWAYDWCAYVKIADELGMAINNIISMVEGSWQIKEDYCDRIEDKKKKEKEGEEEGRYYGG